jgi:GT2 family glycosyltransferase
MKRIAKLTAIISTLNRPELLARCLDALLAGDVLPAEIIIVDQSADHKTGLVVAQRTTTAVRIHYLRQEQRGLSASRNAAVGCATFPLLAITDDDCVPDKRWIAIVERVFSSVKAPDALTGRVLPLGQEVPGLYAVSSRSARQRVEFSGRVEPWLVGTGGNFAIKQEWLERVGTFDERLGAGSPGGGAEDIDLLYRLASAGARILYDPDALIYHERQSKVRRLASRLTYGRGIGVFCAKWMRRRDPYAWRILGQWLFLRARLTASALRRGRLDSVYEEWLVLQGTARGLLQGIFRLPKVAKGIRTLRGGSSIAGS